MYHIKDSEFIRGKIPMTKQEVRSVSISKLELNEDSVLIDVGAGSGSIGIEASRYLNKGKVVGIEINPDGIDIIKQNLAKFNVINYELIEGKAPADLPEMKFDRMFIGGSKGHMKIIIDYFMQNTQEGAVLVVNVIALESLSSALEELKSRKFSDVEIVSMTVARNKSVGSLNMMMGENPIYIITAKR